MVRAFKNWQDPRLGRRLSYEALDERLLLAVTTGLAAVPDFSVIASTAKPAGISAAQLNQAYGVSNITFAGTQGNGAGQTIAIVSAYDPANIQADVQAFDAAEGLPAISLLVVNENGGTSLPVADKTWALNATADVEAVHAAAPGASILLVLANTNTLSDLFAASDWAKNQPGVSVDVFTWNTQLEFQAETADDQQHLQTPTGHNGITFIDSAGDFSGQGVSTVYPAISPNVLSVGGTSLSVASNGAYVSDTAAYNSSGGSSLNNWELEPAYQSAVANEYKTRGAGEPAISDDGAWGTGYSVYDTSAGYQGWNLIDGDGLAATQVAGIIAIANQGRQLSGLSALNGSSQTLSDIYGKLTSDFHDVTSGSNSAFKALAGYDYASGWGTPNAPLLVSDLSGFSVVTASASSNPLVDGQSVTLSAKVSSVASGVFKPSGTVMFMDGAVKLGTAALIDGVATLSTSLLTPGPNAITAVYNGDTNFGLSTSTTLNEVVVVPTSVALSLPSSSIVQGQSATITITVSNAVTGASPPTGTVTLFNGNTAVGTIALTAGKAVFSTAALPAGQDALTAVYNGDALHESTTSPRLVLMVNTAATTASASPLKASAIDSAMELMG